MKKLVSKLLTLLLAASMTASVCASPSAFRDVSQTHWAKSYIDTAYENGWVNGMSADQYAPNEEVTVAQWITMVTRLAYPAPVKQEPEPGKWYSEAWYGPYMQVATTRMLDYFLPESIFTKQDMNRPITRAEMACIVTGVLDWYGIQLTPEQAYHTLKTVPDLQSDEIRPYLDGVVRTYASAIITGVDTSGRFDGFSPMTRAQAATVLCRMYQRIEDLLFIDPNPFLPPVNPEPQPEPEPRPEPETQPAPIIDPSAVTAKILALKSEYPEGTPWTNANSYQFRGAPITGYGCAGFAFLLSDAAFGDLPVTEEHSDFDRIRPGDILRINHDTHSVVVLEIKDQDTLIIAEGNYNSSVHWGRELTRSMFYNGETIVTTRYPI